MEEKWQMQKGSEAWFMQQPSIVHYGAAKRVLRYIAETLGYGVWYSKTSNFRLSGFTDSDWASSLDDRRSVSANVFTLGSGVITWSSKKKATAALSTLEAEYIAATSAACQAIWLRRVLADLQHEQKEATEIFCDNQATITMTKKSNIPWQNETYRHSLSFYTQSGCKKGDNIGILQHSRSAGRYADQVIIEREVLLS
ncbi:secreted RxLR effector protein 161-like [Gossypium raimondii]|uniref:secreted RxLR effector protein 161-like n=1 Tax=Gossypium raimondii TaxID=29730 RepID=UPI00227B0E8D|nr:secreted RxLR effector protein 161-like [Gossypium raimondii]